MGREDAATLLDVFDSCRRDAATLGRTRDILGHLDPEDRRTVESAFDVVGRLGGGLTAAQVMCQATAGICRAAAFPVA